MSKWYNNLFAYKLNNVVSEQEIKKIEDHKIKEIGKSEKEVSGWDYVLEESDLYVKVGNAFLLNFRTDKKNIPGGIIKQKVKERIKKLKAQGVEKPNKKEVKEQIENELLKDAFYNTKEVLGYIDNDNKLLVINSNSAKDIDAFIDFLRDETGELDLDMIEIDFDITETLTDWLIEKQAKEPFELGEDCTLNDSLSGSKAKLSRQDLSSEEIDILLKSGKKVSEVNLEWEERVSFNLTNEFKIKQIKPKPVIGELLSEEVGEDESAYTAYVTSMTIMLADFAQLIQDLLKEE
jgi:recombination associated protein RdgC